MIKIIGLGIVDGDISTRGLDALQDSKLAVFKTGVPATYALHERIALESITLDDIYEEADDFDDVNVCLVDRLIDLDKKHGDIAYLVNGSGSDDRTISMLIERGVDVALYPSSAKESTFNMHDTSYLAVSAYDLVNERVFMPDSAYPVIIKDIDNICVAGAVKLILEEVFDDEEEIRLMTLEGEKTIHLYELDRQPIYDYYTALYIKSSDYTKKKTHTMSDLLRIMYRLRDRENGCAWDKVQTHESIRRNVIEEAYELVSAIDNEDIDNMLEECGDIMLQSVFHSAIAEDMGEFTFGEVVSALCNKLVTRHTHIFGDVVANNPEEALKAWDAAKAKEKSQQSLTQKLEGIADSLPAIMQAEKAQKYASKMGLDFASIEDAKAKISEELREFMDADDDNKEMEAGDLLFSVINVLRLSHVEGEVALRRSAEKFVRRCETLEKLCKRDGVELSKMSPETFDNYWEEIKTNEDR